MNNKKGSYGRKPPQKVKDEIQVHNSCDFVNYKFIDGLRGIGALFVYYAHFYNVFLKKEYNDRPVDIYTPVINIVTNGRLWVMVFFSISGFVLPLRLMK